MSEHLGHKRSAEAERYHLAQERPSRSAAGPHFFDLLPQLLLVEHVRPCLAKNRNSRWRSLSITTAGKPRSQVN
jgi:hypothetical protein